MQRYAHSGPAMSDSETLLQFFRGEIEGPRGMTLRDCLNQSNQQLEDRHDYIQWVFPSPQRSAFNDWAPVFEEEAAHEFRKDPALRRQLLECLERMLQFYDMKLVCKPNLKVGAESDGSALWARIVLDEEAYSQERIHNTILGSYSKFHNLLRLTRMMLSLKTAGLPRMALMLHRVLVEDVRGVVEIPDRTVRFWDEAVADITLQEEREEKEEEKEAVRHGDVIAASNVKRMVDREVVVCANKRRKPLLRPPKFQTARGSGKRRRKRLARRYRSS